MNARIGLVTFIYLHFFHNHSPQHHTTFGRLFPSSGELKLTSHQINHHKSDTSPVIYS